MSIAAAESFIVWDVRASTDGTTSDYTLADDCLLFGEVENGELMAVGLRIEKDFPE